MKIKAEVNVHHKFGQKFMKTTHRNRGGGGKSWRISRVGIANVLAVEQWIKEDGRRETEKAREAEELCQLGGSGSSWRKMAFPPEEKSWTNPDLCICTGPK